VGTPTLSFTHPSLVKLVDGVARHATTNVLRAPFEWVAVTIERSRSIEATPRDIYEWETGAFRHSLRGSIEIGRYMSNENNIDESVAHETERQWPIDGVDDSLYE
jgi:hypothetical protein